ncbi:MAG: SPOR domain-containing protein [Pseudomonadota bacterium]
MIIVGGAFAYGYNILFSTSSKKTGTPVVNRSEEPARVQPADPGGRKFENTDSQLMDRIGNRGQAGNTAQEDAGGNRVRTVSTLVVGRDGRLIVENKDADQQPASQDRSQSAAASQVANDAPSGIPGMIIEGRNQQPDQRTNENQPAAPSQQAAVAVPPVSTPRVQQPTTDTDVQEEPSQPVVVRRRNSKFPPLPQRSGVDKPGVDLGPETPVPTTSEDEQFDSAPQSDLTQAAAGPAPNGYVAVLSTKRSRIDALTSFADLQQRYPNILGTKVPDVRRADLTSRGLGVMYRAVVGPPGSREVASQLCDRLKTVGYGNCWVSAY